MMMMASTSLSSSGFEDHDHLNMFAAADNNGNDNNSLQLLEEGLSDNIIDNSTHGNESSGAQQQQQQHDRSQQEAVALLAFNKAFEQNKSSSSSSSTSSINIDASSKNNTPSRTATSSSCCSASAILHASHGGIIHNDGGGKHDSTHATIKVEAPPSKPMQHSPGNRHNTSNDNINNNDDDDDISLNSADLQSPGGFDGSMSISDFLMDDSPNKPNNTNGSSSQLFNGGGSSSKSSFNIDKTFRSSNVNNMKGGVRRIQQLRHSSSMTSTGSSVVVGESSNHNSSNNKFMSSLSGLFKPISKRKREQQQQQIFQGNSAISPLSSSATSYDTKSFGLIRNNNTSRQKQLLHHQQQQQQRLRQQQQQHDNNNDSNNNNSWKGSSALSIATCNSTAGNSILKSNSISGPLKKKHSRVSWQIRDDDLEKDLSFATGGSKPSFFGSKPSFFGSSSNNSTSSSSSRPSKRNSSWTITDLECLSHNSPNNIAEGGGGGYEGDDSSSSQFQKSILTPEEQHLWASMLQLANISGTTTLSNDVNGGKVSSGDHVGDALAESSALTKTKSIQDAMNVAAAAILQTDAAMGRDAVGDAAPDGDLVEAMTLSRGKSLATPVEENPPRSSSPSSQAPPPPQQQPSLSTDITPATAVTVTTLAYQEVEEYRERLRRKREEMEGIDSSSSFSSQQQQQQQSSPPTELSDLNSLLLENATNINNAVLLQRALYALRIHRGSLMDGNNAIDTSNNNNNVNGDASDQPTSLSRSRFSRSEHSGLDHLALNHLLTLSSSVRSSGTAGSGSGRNSNSTWRTAAQAAAASLTRSSQPPSPPAVSTADNVQRRHTLLGTQPGAYSDPNPAPLLFRRTFANPNRRESRQAARRNTLDALHLQRTSNVTTDSGSSVGYQQQQDQQNQPQLQHRRTSSLDSGPSSAANNDSSQNMDEEFANTLQYPSTHNDAPENSITAQVTPYNPDDESYNRRHLGTLLESTQSQQSTSSINTHTDRRALFGAQSSVRRQSRRALQMIQAVLVSDEIVEAVEAEHIPNGEDGFLFPNDLERMDMMEELLEEKEEEARMIEDRYRRRERVWMVVVTVLVVVVVALVVTAAKR